MDLYSATTVRAYSTGIAGVLPQTGRGKGQGLAVLFVVSLAGFPLRNATAEDTAWQPIAVWDVMARATAGAGYRDNVLRSGIAQEDSAFSSFSADAMALWLSESGAHLTFFVLFDDTHYFDAPSVDYERFFSATLQGAVPVGPKDEAGAQNTILYQHQVVDVSENDARLSRTLVTGSSYLFRPYWKHAVDDDWAVQAEGEVFRQFYHGDISDYWATAAGLRVVRGYGYRSELSVSAHTKLLPYDSRRKFDPAGVVIRNTDLAYRQNEIAAQWKHHFDESRHWRSRLKLSYLISRDNGSGYFDYDRLLCSAQVRWKKPQWEVKATASFSGYSYPSQERHQERFERSSWVLDGRIERKVGEHVIVYTFAEYERGISNANWPR